MITAFVPCRAGSQRVKDKNTRPFAGVPGGLLELKLRQLKMVPSIDRILISSDDPRVIAIADRARGTDGPAIDLDIRPRSFARSDTSMQSFIRDYIVQRLDFDIMLWTHVTHPFVTANVYSNVLRAFQEGVKDHHDSLVTVTRVQEFLWKNGKPYNYDSNEERWPRSQDIEPLWRINHAAYVISKATMTSVGDRVGDSPLFVELGSRDSFDIDWPDDFELAELIARSWQNHSGEASLL